MQIAGAAFPLEELDEVLQRRDVPEGT